MTRTIEIDISCCLCETKTITTTKIPEGWEPFYNGIDVEKAFCPEHSNIKEWADANCPGCVGGWQDCDLWSNFAYSYAKVPVTEKDLQKIACGKCPRRTNGTFAINRNTGESTTIDLSTQATTESGEAFAAAIRAYMQRYGIGVK